MSERAGDAMSSDRSQPGPPPLRPFGLLLHHDGRWTHEGVPILNRKLRERFDRSVRYLSDEAVYVVQIGHFRGQIEIEEAGFFVRAFDAERGVLALSDGSSEPVEVASLSVSSHDGALLCRVKRPLCADGLPARFFQAAQADLFQHVVETPEGFALDVGGALYPMPEL
jgi:hypothetical protein